MNADPQLPYFAELALTEAAAARVARVQAHRASMKCCWPKWDGPKVGGRCTVGSCVVASLTHGGKRYHYMAPCKILEITPDGETLIVEVDYAPEVVGCYDRYNGERLRLDILEVWADCRR